MNRIQQLQQLAEAGMQSSLPAEESRNQQREDQRFQRVATRLTALHGSAPFQHAIRRCGVWKGDRELIRRLRALWMEKTAEKIRAKRKPL